MTSHNNANNTDSEKLIWDDSLDELIDPQIISELTGCERLHLPREVLDGGALPGQVLARKGVGLAGVGAAGVGLGSRLAMTLTFQRGGPRS